MKKKQDNSRRDFIKNAALGSAMIGTLGSFDLVTDEDTIAPNKSDKLHLKMTGYDYKRLLV